MEKETKGLNAMEKRSWVFLEFQERGVTYLISVIDEGVRASERKPERE